MFGFNVDFAGKLNRCRWSWLRASCFGRIAGTNHQLPPPHILDVVRGFSGPVRACRGPRAICAGSAVRYYAWCGQYGIYYNMHVVSAVPLVSNAGLSCLRRPRVLTFAPVAPPLWLCNVD